MTQTFDPAVEVGKLVEHLAAHDKPTAFLFGAGTSSSVQGRDAQPLIPAVAGLTELCKTDVDALGDQFSTAWQAIWESLPAHEHHIEGMLSAVRNMHRAALPGDKLAGLAKDSLAMFEQTIQTTISKAVQPSISRTPSELPHRHFVDWIRRTSRATPVEIFTTNYDTLIESALESYGVPVFDGFVGALSPFFEPSTLSRDSMSPGRDWTRLWKIHGSVTWRLADIGGETRVVRGEPNETGEMILPSTRKYDESKKQPYLAMLDRLGRCMSSQSDVVLVAAGYGFGDQHINELLVAALDEHPRVHIFALMYSDPTADHPVHKLALRHRNLTVLARSMAIVGGVVGKWRAPTTAVGGFSLPASTFAANSTGDGGSLKLGDFNRFCDLAGGIGSRR